MSTLDRWVETVCAELRISPQDVDIRAVLDLARDVARGVDRPAAPLTAYLLGIAVGRGVPAPDAARRLSGLAQEWAAAQPPGEEPQA